MAGQAEQVATGRTRVGAGAAGRVPIEERRHTTIRPARGWASLQLRETWRYRELLYFLVWRDIKVRYRQTLLGAGWALAQPFMMMVVFTIVLGGLANLPSDGKPYPLFVFSGALIWTFFATALNAASNSLAGGGGLISKVYFPRLILPTASTGAMVVDLALALGLLGAIMAWYGEAPSKAVVLFPLFVLLALATALAAGLWLGALNVRYRDVRAIVPFLTQLWFFLTPVAYTAELVPEKWQLVYTVNPMATAVLGARWALVGTPPPPLEGALASVAVVALILVASLTYFRKVERTFADVI